MTEREGYRPGTGPLLTVAEVADSLRVSTMTVYRLINGGELSAIRVGKNYRIPGPALDGYLASGTVQVDRANG
jgi:excisionase family DNA binding protein